MVIALNFYDFLDLKVSSQESYLKGYINKIIEQTGLSTLRSGMGGHDETMHCITKSIHSKIEDMEDSCFAEDNDSPYMLSDKEVDVCIDRMLNDNKSNSLFIDSDRATVAIYYAIQDQVLNIINWLNGPSYHSETTVPVLQISADFDGSHLGAGCLRHPIGNEIGKMFPEISPSVAKIILERRTLLSDCFYRVSTAYPDLYNENGTKTGRYFDDIIKEKIKDFPPFYKAYWSFALSGYQMFDNFNSGNINARAFFSMDFSHENRTYRISFNDESSYHSLPKIREKIGDKFQHADISTIPEEVMSEIRKIKVQFDNCEIKPARIINNKLICEEKAREPVYVGGEER